MVRRLMIPSRVFRYRDPASVYLGLDLLRRQGLTPRGILFIALDPRGETHIAVPDNMDAVTEMRVGDKLTLEPPWEGRYFHFDAIHRLPGDTVLWNGDRRLADTGSAPEVAAAVTQWLRGSSAKSLFLGCTSHQPGSWWTQNPRSRVTALQSRGFVETVVSNAGLLARRTGEPTLYHLTFAQLAHTGPLEGWTPVYDSPFGSILMVERRVKNYRLALSCRRGVVEIDVSGVPDIRETARVALESGFGILGRVEGGAFAVTSGRVQDWGLSDLAPALLVGAPNETILDLARSLRIPSAMSIH
jgi:hypothetical protein